LERDFPAAFVRRVVLDDFRALANAIASNHCGSATVAFANAATTASPRVMAPQVLIASLAMPATNWTSRWPEQPLFDLLAPPRGAVAPIVDADTVR
jgi:hypothetical protein